MKKLVQNWKHFGFREKIFFEFFSRAVSLSRFPVSLSSSVCVLLFFCLQKSAFSFDAFVRYKIFGFCALLFPEKCASRCMRSPRRERRPKEPSPRLLLLLLLPLSSSRIDVVVLLLVALVFFFAAERWRLETTAPTTATSSPRTLRNLSSRSKFCTNRNALERECAK